MKYLHQWISSKFCDCGLWSAEWEIEIDGLCGVVFHVPLPRGGSAHTEVRFRGNGHAWADCDTLYTVHREKIMYAVRHGVFNNYGIDFTVPF